MAYAEAFLGIGSAIAAYQIWVTLKLIRTPLYESNQKWLQSVLIWLVPVLGAVIVHIMMWSDGRPPYKPEKGYTEPGDHAS